MEEAEQVLRDARAVLNPAGISVARVSFVASGATAQVWKLESASKTWALRIVTGNRGAEDQVGYAIRRELFDRGGHVAEPVLTSAELQPIAGRDWSLDRFIHGVHPARGCLPDRAAVQLGQTLSLLHHLPARGFGRPSGMAEGTAIGPCEAPMDGVRHRFENPLPECWPRGYTHPLLTRLPELRDQILSRLARVTERVQQGHGVLCHSDLHERQFICSGDDLGALIDFGDVTLMDQHWDLGSLLYFHGPEICGKVLRGYGATQICPDMVASFSIAVAMHHASRARLPGKEHRFDVAAKYIRRLLSDVDRDPA
ncbi:aminoglycoside phosphotransferase family protein [Palleronia caenipelagi]|nr:aminoglycoside phosphotransferase family protein [Palleronia caenipelagi]